MTLPQLPDLRGLPYYDEAITYWVYGNRSWAWEFAGWKPESMSWKTGCYIHGGLSDSQVIFNGPDVVRLFESLCVNNFEQFSIGSMKHAIMCTPAGLIATHGILQRNAEDQVRFYAGGTWPVFHAINSKFRVKVEFPRWYLFQVAGPTSLQTLERAADESLGDMRFLRFRTAKIAGKTVEIGRLGMSGNLAYEVRGPIEDGAEVYDAIFRAGEGLGIQRLGWRSYLVNHVEGGFPQVFWTFFPAMLDYPGFEAFMGNTLPRCSVTGSVDPRDMRARYRTPVEVGWSSTVRLNHDFMGRAAVEKELANPSRTVATLRWNSDDVLDIYRSLLQPGDEFKTLDLPTSPAWSTTGWLAHADSVLKNGKRVGISSGTIYSYYFREVLSMVCIDIDQAAKGNEVIVEWGDFGKRIKQVRATVERFPYLTEGRNDKVDTSRPGYTILR